MRGIKPPVLFELHAENGGMPWSCATSHKGGTHSLAPRPGSLVRLTFQIGPRGRTCTYNRSVLGGMPLNWATRGVCTRPSGAPGQRCTDTLRDLNPPRLHWATGAS